NPELAEEAHHMIDAKRTSWRHLRPQRFDERPVTSLAEPVGDEGREAPVLAESVELVRRGADTHTWGEQVLPRPGVEACRVEADRHVLHEHRAGGDAVELEAAQPLQPLVVADAVG